jgi:hypothetical protein
MSAPDGPPMYVPTMDVFLNRWFRTYEEARRYLDTEGGFLFPYGEQYFVTEEVAIRELGLDPADPDWGRIGRDWVHPVDRAAWERLRHLREIAA